MIFDVKIQQKLRLRWQLRFGISEWATNATSITHKGFYIDWAFFRLTLCVVNDSDYKDTSL